MLSPMQHLLGQPGRIIAALDRFQIEIPSWGFANIAQTVMSAQELYARAALVDPEHVAKLQDVCDPVEAEEYFRGCFFTDVRPIPPRVARHSRLAPRSLVCSP